MVKNSPNWPFLIFLWTFVHSKCKRSSLRSQCWMRHFRWFFKQCARSCFSNCSWKWPSTSSTFSLSLPLHSLEDPLVKKATFIHILALVRLFSIHSLQRSPRKRPPLVPKQSTVSANFYPWPRQQKQPFDLFLPSNDLLHINKHKNKKIHCYQETFIHLWNK